MDSEREQPAPAPTGDPRVDAAVERLAALDDLDLADRPAVLEDVHGRLRDILGELGEAGGHAQDRPAQDRPAQDRPAQDRPAEPGRHGEQGQLGARRW
ncbi:MAG TPA: hypothetical protein VGM12_08100 [Trebonia sp.]|jgi:hypothetical protein